MKLVAIIISILVTTKAKSIKENNETICEGVMIDGVYHEKEVLKTGLRWPISLVIDHASDNLYFSYSVDNLNSDEDSQSARLDVNTKDFELITGVKDGFAQTVDPKTQDVYIGGGDGIYKYDRKNKKAELYAGKGKFIWTLFFKDVLYVSFLLLSPSSNFLYTVSNGKTVRFKDLEDTKINYFLIDKEDTMFYTNFYGSGLYSQKKGTKKSVLIKQSESLTCNCLTADLKDNVYVCGNDGIIYVVNKTEAELVKVADIDALGLAFDSHNNMIYSTYDEQYQIVRLKPNKNKFCFNLTQSN